ncbi:hypothetical protein HDV00_009576 [Rhizophlyctis rosea]|nr:hypothetical protein HDV00_009576 [Rhizophlyctis rosea]
MPLSPEKGVREDVVRVNEFGAFGNQGGQIYSHHHPLRRHDQYSLEHLQHQQQLQQRPGAYMPGMEDLRGGFGGGGGGGGRGGGAPVATAANGGNIDASPRHSRSELPIPIPLDPTIPPPLHSHPPPQHYGHYSASFPPPGHTIIPPSPLNAQVTHTSLPRPGASRGEYPPPPNPKKRVPSGSPPGSATLRKRQAEGSGSNIAGGAASTGNGPGTNPIETDIDRTPDILSHRSTLDDPQSPTPSSPSSSRRGRRRRKGRDRDRGSEDEGDRDAVVAGMLGLQSIGGVPGGVILPRQDVMSVDSLAATSSVTHPPPPLVIPRRNGPGPSPSIPTSAPPTLIKTETHSPSIAPGFGSDALSAGGSTKSKSRRKEKHKRRERDKERHRSHSRSRERERDAGFVTVGNDVRGDLNPKWRGQSPLSAPVVPLMVEVGGCKAMPGGPPPPLSVSIPPRGMVPAAATMTTPTGLYSSTTSGSGTTSTTGSHSSGGGGGGAMMSAVTPLAGHQYIVPVPKVYGAATTEGLVRSPVQGGGGYIGMMGPPPVPGVEMNGGSPGRVGDGVDGVGRRRGGDEGGGRNGSGNGNGVGGNGGVGEGVDGGIGSGKKSRRRKVEGKEKDKEREKDREKEKEKIKKHHPDLRLPSSAIPNNDVSDRTMPTIPIPPPHLLSLSPTTTTSRGKSTKPLSTPTTPSTSTRASYFPLTAPPTTTLIQTKRETSLSLDDDEDPILTPSALEESDVVASADKLAHKRRMNAEAARRCRERKAQRVSLLETQIQTYSSLSTSLTSRVDGLEARVVEQEEEIRRLRAEKTEWESERRRWERERGQLVRRCEELEGEVGRGRVELLVRAAEVEEEMRRRRGGGLG